MDWWYRWPSTTVRWKLSGDGAKRLQLEGTKLLHQLKKFMQMNKLGQLRATRIFNDGSVVVARSFFGMDFIEIRSSVEISELLACSVTLMDMPEVVRPMRYPGGIHTGEIDGVDYIKTYYTLDLSQCGPCTAGDVSVDFTFIDSSIPHATLTDDHCIYTESHCWGQEISKGEDVNGRYIIWKAFTEDLVYTRSGLGYANISIIIRDPEQKVVCTATALVKVDCCERPNCVVDAAWEHCIGDSYCHVPPVISLTELEDYALYYGGKFYPYDFTGDIGGCIPYEWTISGPGSLESGYLGLFAKYHLPTSRGCQDVTITVKDRCTKESSFKASCCDLAEELAIQYSSLIMPCGYYQLLLAEGGCPPYTWSMVSGGGSLSHHSGGGTYYTAPVTNPSCTQNPTIRLTDCCGGIAEVSIAVNCYTVAGAYAIGVAGVWICTDCEYHVGGAFCEPDCWRKSAVFYHHGWSCEGTQVVDCHTYPVGCMYGGCGDGCSGAGPYYTFPNQDSCDDAWEPCVTGQCSSPAHYAACGALADDRSVHMIEEGCCPINPLTGLPY